MSDLSQSVIKWEGIRKEATRNSSQSVKKERKEVISDWIQALKWRKSNWSKWTGRKTGD